MRTSVIRHPKFSRFLKIHDWQMAATGDNRTASALLSLFEFDYNGLLKQDFSNRWLFYTDEELSKGILGISSRETINSAIASLNKLGFISTDCDAETRIKHNAGRKKCIKFLAKSVNDYIESYEILKYGKPAINAESPVLTDLLIMMCLTGQNAVIEPETRPKPVVKGYTKGQTAQAEDLFEFWGIVCGKRRTSKTNDKIEMICETLKIGYTFTHCLQAIFGSIYSLHHQGINDRDKKYTELIYTFGKNYRKNLDTFKELSESFGGNEIKIQELFLNRNKKDFTEKLKNAVKKAKAKQNEQLKPNGQIDTSRFDSPGEF
jgi:hypothetical protein